MNERDQVRQEIRLTLEALLHRLTSSPTSLTKIEMVGLYVSGLVHFAHVHMLLNGMSKETIKGLMSTMLDQLEAEVEKIKG